MSALRLRQAGAPWTGAYAGGVAVSSTRNTNAG